MFNSLKDKITALFSSNYSTAEKLILEIFAPLISLDETLPKRIVGYVMQGENANVLVELEQVPAKKIVTILDFEGLMTSSFSDNFASKNKTITQSKVARRSFHTQWIEVYTAEQIIRFGKVSAAIYKELALSLITPKLPLWFLHLFYNGLVITLQDVKNT